MKSRLFILTVILLSVSSGLYLAYAQQSDEEVRGAFLSTRPKTTNTSAPPRRRRPPQRSSNTSASTTKNTNTPKNTGDKNTNGATGNNAFANTNSAHLPSQAIGLGYTLFMRDAEGRTVRVEPTHEFHNGDRIRLSMEPNIDGYLYIFDSEDGAPPQMIYPDPRLDGGENWIEAHVPMDLPSSAESDERLRWFQFYGNPGKETIYIVVSRDPLPAVPYGDNLTSYCSSNKDKCPWRPTAEIWAQLQQASRADVKVVASASFGQPLTEKEQTATTRGLGLDQSAPQPSVIRMNASSNAPVLVAVLDLVHK
jgi:hypothetical protein